MVKRTWKEKQSQVTAQEEFLEHWVYEDDRNVKMVANIRHFFSDWDDSRQIFITKSDHRAKIAMAKFAMQPTMAEKRDVLLATNAMISIHECVAFEIFPKWEKIVDDHDMYHLWLVSKKKIPFCSATTKVPKFMRLNNRIIIDGVTYKYNSKVYKEPGVMPVTVFFVKLENGLEMNWYEKQSFKDFVIGKNRVAIEIQREGYYDYAILIRLPLTKEIPFGLTSINSKNNFEEEP